MNRHRERRRFRGGTGEQLRHLTLDRLAVGDQARVTAIPSRDARLLRKLAALGLLPGVKLTLLQRVPTYVVRLGFIEIALGRELAAVVEVTREAP